MGLGDFLRRKDDDNDDNFEDDEELDLDGYYVLSKEGAKQILGWARFHAQLCEMMHEGNIETCDDDTHKVAMLMVFALQPWLLYYNMLDEVEIDKDEDDNE